MSKPVIQSVTRGGKIILVFGTNFVEHSGHAESAEKCTALSVLFGVMEVAAEMFADSFTLTVSDGYRRLEWKGDIERVRAVVEEVSRHV